MCELLVRIEDRGCGQSFAGDVIHVADNGWCWGQMERISPYRVIVVEADSSYFVDMLEPLIAPNGEVISKRAAYFDLSLISEKPTYANLMAAKRTRRSAGVIG